MRVYKSDIVREIFESITPLERATYMLSDSIAERIEAVMKCKGISKSQLAKMTGHRPCEVTKWLSGEHNFTCKTIATISLALGTNIVKATKQDTSMSPRHHKPY